MIWNTRYLGWFLFNFAYSKLIQFPQGVGKDWKEEKLQYASWSPQGHSLVRIKVMHWYVLINATFLCEPFDRYTIKSYLLFHCVPFSV